MNAKSTLFFIALLLFTSCAKPSPTLTNETQPTATPTSVPSATSTPLPIVYLSDLEPTSISVGHASLGRGTYTWNDEKFTVGETINSFGNSYRHGLLAYAPSTIEYALDGNFQSLTTYILIDNKCPFGDGVLFRIVVDDKLAYSNGNSVTIADDPELVTVDLTGANTLKLITDSKKPYNWVCDVAIWGDPVLTVAEGVVIPPTKTPPPLRTETVPQGDASPAIEHLVWAVYYPWYMESFYPRAWSSDIWTDRPLTPYESNDPQGIRHHIEWAKSAGIDGFLVEWCGIGHAGDNDVIDNNLKIVLDIADELDFKIAAYFDRLCVHETEIEPLKQQLKYLLTVRAQHPAYYWMNGKPVVVMFDTNGVPLGYWVNIFDSLAEEGLSATYVADTYDANQLSVFSGLHRYVNFDEGNLKSIYADLERRVDRARQEVPGQTFFWAATVTPGFDNTPIYLGRDQLNPGMPKSDILIKNRNGDQTYLDSWELAIQSGADWIIITSWNEWQENTHIEPSQMYGDSFLLLTKTLIEMWRSTFP